ncbi:hypothetical protein [Micromonospora musae]|uniref:hypothetical protein n=1 Tax=Micromonospora musae TaxID=1894970 RepID=UPI0034320525
MTALISITVLEVAEFAPALRHHFGTARTWRHGPPLAAPGVYVWAAKGAVLYIGSAASLADRLAGYHGWITKYNPEERWEVSVIHMLKTHGANVCWLPTIDHPDALLLESRLIEWHRAKVGIAPVVVGWEAKTKSRRAAAETWARNLWNDQQPPVGESQRDGYWPGLGQAA